MLADVYVQQKNFYGAFIQAKAYDKRFGKGLPVKTMELAAIAGNNNDIQTAISAFIIIPHLLIGVGPDATS